MRTMALSGHELVDLLQTNREKIKIYKRCHDEWVMLQFTMVTNVSLIENQKHRIGEKCLLSTAIKPYLPKVVDEVETPC